MDDKKLSIPCCIVLLTTFILQTTHEFALDPSQHISRYARTAWRMQDGHFVGAPWSITQSKDEYVWIATVAEPVRFDGVRFVPRTPPGKSHTATV